MTRKSPVVYISYCRSSEEDTEWVKRLAERLRNDGVRALLDVWELRPGMPIDEWYWDAIKSSNFVLMIGSSAFSAEFSNERRGDITSLEIELDALRDTFDQTKSYIPVLFPGIAASELPPPFQNRFGIRMGLENPDLGYTELLDALTGRKHPMAPPVRERNLSDRDPFLPVVLKELKLQNFRRVDELELYRPPAEVGTIPQTGQWTMLLGDNGAGKSSILWALGLGLLDRDLVHGILANISAPLIREGQHGCQVLVSESSATYHVSFADHQGRESILESSGSPDFLIFGYGSARGSAFGGPRRAVDLDRPLDAVSTLYGIRTNLIHAETWLQGLEHSALKAGKENGAGFLFQNVCSVLTNVLPGIDSVKVDAEQVRFIGPAVGNCTTDSLSDGYATTLGWIVDMMARWIHEQLRLGRSIPQDFNREMTGLVLIDELDLHLHPRWQMRIIDDVRNAFPKMSFVATTHNPLTLLGAKAGEIFVIDSSTDSMNVRQVDLPPGIRADQILTGIWFGLSSTLDLETQHMLDQHREMLRAGATQTAPERVELERQLRTRLGSFADTTADRVAQEIVTRELEKVTSPLTPFELETVRDKVQKALTQKP
jgi:hypothetical protein